MKHNGQKWNARENSGCWQSTHSQPSLVGISWKYLCGERMFCKMNKSLTGGWRAEKPMLHNATFGWARAGGVLLLPETNILLSPLEPHLWNIFDCSDKSYTQWNVDGDDHHDCHHHSYHSIEYLASHFHSKIFRFPFWGKWGIIVDFWTVWRRCTARCCVKRDNL